MKSLVAFQGTIATTGTAQNLPSNPVLKSVTIAAKSGNTAAIVIGAASTVVAATGFILAAGTSVSIPLPGGDTDQLWVVGTSGDIFSVVGA